MFPVLDNEWVDPSANRPGETTPGKHNRSLVSYLGGAARLVLAGVFLLAASSKLFAWEDSIWIARAACSVLHCPFPSSLALATLIGSELGIGLLLLHESVYRIGAAVSLIFVLAATVVALSLQSRGLLYECGCFGNMLHLPLGPELVGRNLALALISFWVAVDRTGRGEEAVERVLSLLNLLFVMLICYAFAKLTFTAISVVS